MGSLCVKRRENDCTIPVTYCSPQLHVNIVILLHQDQFPSAILSFGCHFPIFSQPSREELYRIQEVIFLSRKNLNRTIAVLAAWIGFAWIAKFVFLHRRHSTQNRAKLPFYQLLTAQSWCSRLVAVIQLNLSKQSNATQCLDKNA